MVRWKNLGEELVKVGAVTDLLQCNSRVSAFAPPTRFARFGGVPHTIRSTRFLHVTDGINPCVCVDRVHGAAMIELKTYQTSKSKEDGKNGTSRRSERLRLRDQTKWLTSGSKFVVHFVLN